MTRAFFRRTRHVAVTAILAGVLALAAAPALAQPLADPRVDWSTAETPHFRIHYRSTQRAQAEAVARAAERVWPKVTKSLDWEVRGRTEIVLYDEFDIANGFSTPLPFNMIGVFLAPPDEGELLDNQAWLDLLLVHEFTHAVQFDKVRGTPRVLQSIFGNVPWFIPAAFQPSWMAEGLAVLNESRPAAGEGRLQGPVFEAWLRAERARGFISLRELNADGRRLPMSKQYLYGAYFMDYLARRHGPDAVKQLVEHYAGNPPLWPRLHGAPWAATGQTMDELWTAFLDDLGQRVDARGAALRAQPEAVGTALAGPLFDVGSVAALPGGGWLAVVRDGLNGTRLMRIEVDGSRRAVTRLNPGARVDVGAGGAVTITQPDICDKVNFAYDVHRLEGERLVRLTECQRLRRATQTAGAVWALQLDGGRTRLVQLAERGAAPKPVWTPPEGTDLVDLAAAPDGRSLRLITHAGADWRVIEVDSAAPQTVRTLVRRNQPLQALRQGAAGLELVMAEGGVPNVWRLQGDTLQRLTHAWTGVLNHAGSAPDGSLLSVVIAPGGVTLNRLPVPAPLQQVVAQQAEAPVAAAPAPAAPVLGEGRAYSALSALRPRSWLPAITSDRGLTAYGASTAGGDALGWHRYAALAQIETSQKELVGSLEYQFAQTQGLALLRQLTPVAYSSSGGKDTTTVYDRRTKLQWLSQLPFSRLERRVVLGVGAAADLSDRVSLPAGTTTRRRDERLLAGLVDLDFSGSDLYSEGPNRGFAATALVESYKPLAGSDPLRYDGTVARADLRGYLPLGRAVLAARWTEARARGRTEPFQLGGATDEVLQFGPVLNNRNLALRGYGGDERVLQGQNVRVLSLELRTPLLDVDRHFMTPALGLNRLSAAVFVDAGGAWNTGSGPDTLRRGVGVELLGELKLLYALGLQLRLGVAQGLDAPKDTRGYLTLGRAF